MMPRPLVPLLSLVLLSACVEEHSSAAQSAIKGGVPSPERSNVVGFAVLQGNGLGACTGSLIAPNLVLTAQHCVAPVASETVQCGQAGFGEPYAPSSFYVSTEAVITQQSAFVGVSEVVVPPGSGDVCGTDVALLVLAENLDVAPLTPRISAPVDAGEPYVAVGYGDTGDGNAGDSFERRERGDLAVDCAGAACGTSSIKASEFLGDTGVCQGDSGGPALDGRGQVVGVASRGGFGCTSPIYGSVASWSDWLRAEGEHAAEHGGYDAPAWVTGAAPSGEGGAGDGGGSSNVGGADETGGAGGADFADDDGEEAGERGDDGCSLAPRARASHSATALLLLGLAALRRRRS